RQPRLHTGARTGHRLLRAGLVTAARSRSEKKLEAVCNGRPPTQDEGSVSFTTAGEDTMHRSFISRRIWLVLGAAAAVALGTGVAFAAIPDSGGVIHACYNKTNGKLRVADATNPKLGDCLASSETALDWNRQGVQGPQGLKGEKGD